MNRPIAIDLFAGAGGLSLGFEQAGFDIVAAVEVDPIHASVHKFNFPPCSVIPRSVVDLSGDDIRTIGGIGRKPVDVVFGGPPCQGFSLMGKRSMDDPRNSLVREFVRLVAELQSSYFVLENVKGLTIGEHKQFLEEIIEKFEELGYQVCQPWQVLNAASFGVPQNRDRLFLLGARKGKPLPSYPSPSTGAASTKTTLPTGPTCKDALMDLPEVEDFEELIDSDEVLTNAWGSPSDYGVIMRCLDHRGWGFGYQRHWNPQLLTNSARTNHTPISRQRFSSTPPGEREAISRFLRLPINGVSNTLRAGTDSTRGAFTSPRPIHYQTARCITVREMARLHGFPDWFRFHATKWHGARQVGNAVPPPLARAVASCIIKCLGMIPTPPKEILDLGDSHLLRMDMRSSSEYWKIYTPISTRTRSAHGKEES